MRLKTLMGLVLAGILASTMYAETPDEEIQRLKKENELLELQKKNDELKKNKDSKKAESSNVDKSGAFGFCKGEYANTGCFIGVEVGYASAENRTYTLVASSFDGTADTYALPINVIFGWQWYFTKNMGLNIKAHIGYANYNGDISINNYESGYSNTLNAKYKSSALHYGVDVAYLYDFISSKNHTFGMHINAGYEFGTFLGQGLSDISSSNDPTFTIENSPFESLDSYTKSAFTGGIGVHYFLNIHHQFWLSYKSRRYSIADGGQLQGLINYATTPSGLISFAYAYKF